MREQKKDYIRWSKRFEQQLYRSPCRTLNELDRVYVYLMEGDKPICFWRGKVSEFTDPNPVYRWIALKCDLAIGSVTEQWRAGMISFKLSINNHTRDGFVDFMQQENWKRLPPKRYKSYLVRAYIYQCKDLTAADDDGAADPYVELWSNLPNRQLTPVVDDNLNPMFFTCLETLVDFDQPETAPPLILNVWDRDDGLLEGDDDFMGRAVFFIPDAVKSRDDSLIFLPDT